MANTHVYLPQSKRSSKLMSNLNLVVVAHMIILFEIETSPMHPMCQLKGIVFDLLLMVWGHVAVAEIYVLFRSSLS